SPRAAGVSRGEVEMLVDLCAVEGAWAVDARGVCEADRGKEAAGGVNALSLGIAPVIDAPGQPVGLVGRDTSCGVDVIVGATAHEGIYGDRTAPGGGTDRNRAQSGDDQVHRGDVAIGELRANFA